MLDAGHYIGPVGAISLRAARPTMLARTGAHVRESIANQYLGAAGIGTYGDGMGRHVPGMRAGVFGDPAPVQLGAFGDLCDQTGSDVAAALRTTAGTSTQPGVLSQIGTAAGADAGATSALGVANAALSFIGTLWGNQCQVQDARASQVASTSPTTPSGSSTAMSTQFQASIQQTLQQTLQAQQQAQQAALQRQQAALAAQQQQAQAAQQHQMLLIGGGLLAAVVVLGGAALLLRR